MFNSLLLIVSHPLLAHEFTCIVRLQYVEATPKATFGSCFKDLECLQCHILGNKRKNPCIESIMIYKHQSKAVFSCAVRNSHRASNIPTETF